jgi:hypothetical protein
MSDTLHLHPEFGPLLMFIIQQNCVDSFLIPICKWEISNSKNWERLFKCNHVGQLLLTSQSWAVILLLILFRATVSWNQSQIYTIYKVHTLFKILCVHVPFLLPVEMLWTTKLVRSRYQVCFFMKKRSGFKCMSLLSCLIANFVSDRNDVMNRQIHKFREILMKFMLVMSIWYVAFYELKPCSNIRGLSWRSSQNLSSSCWTGWWAGEWELL